MTAAITSLQSLMQNLGISFSNVGLLEQALTHSSYSNENPAQPDNERLEFLGDAILGAVVSDLLWRTYPDLHEGQLTRYKAILVQEQGLLPIAERLSLGANLRLGKGEEQTGGREKSSVLSDAVEAVVAAIYLDQGFDVVQNIIEGWYSERLSMLSRDDEHTDHKTKLQEWAQSAVKLTPSYVITGTEGPAHARQYTAEVYLDGTRLGEGHGRSKKLAEQAAAKAALAQRQHHDSNVVNRGAK